MATRHHQHATAAPQPANRGVAVQSGKRKAAAAGQPEAGNPRPRALGDIGNLVRAHVPDRKIELTEGINHPITRSFGAQLLKKAQVNCAVTNKNAIAPAPPRPAPKPVARKPVLMPTPRPELATRGINIGSDKNRKPSEGAPASSAHKLPRKKVVYTLTSVLSHPSKEACGLNRRPKELVEDVDRIAQHESRPVDYMGSQPEINPKMRMILVDWIMEVSHKFKFELKPESFYLTIDIIDRFLSMQVVPQRELQLVGVAAMLIACKYEEIWVQEVNVFVLLADNAYTRQQILGMDKSILNRMSWNLTVPTLYVLLVRFAKAAGSDKELENMVFFFAEMALMEYGLVLLCPSLVAASAVYAARCTMKKTPLWTETLKDHTGFSELQLMEPAKVLVASHAAAPQSKLKAAYRKYSDDQFARVALHPPAQGLV